VITQYGQIIGRVGFEVIDVDTAMPLVESYR